MNLWRFIESSPSDIFTQMALDTELFEEFIQNLSSLPTLRIFRVTEPAFSIGRLWRDKVPLSLPGKSLIPFLGKSLPVCVRPTGGGLVRHGNDLIYSVMARRDSFPTFHQVRTSYLSLHEAIQIAYYNLGVETRLMRCDEAKRDPLRRSGQRREISRCFDEPVATDILIGEKKVAGGGQWRRGGSFLHQGSIQIPPGVSFEEIKRTLQDAFREKFGIAWKEGRPEAVGV